jgi:hypothetical protein
MAPDGDAEADAGAHTDEGNEACLEERRVSKDPT